ncbi:MAG: aldo/keto reductase [Clostridia bacterium]|nr:aldo/keto reductase [Clostridia bacterium]
MSYTSKDVKLNNGKYIPSIGFGTSLVTGEECIRTIEKALKVGYRHIDTASAYENEAEIGNAIKQSKIDRNELFITSKVWKDSMGYENTINSFEKSLKNLDLEYIDLFLIHWPNNKDEQLTLDTWRALEKLYKDGKVKAIGVSNFLKHHLEKLLAKCEIQPMVNQIEFHPGLMRPETLKLCKEKDIVVEAWAPLGKGKMLNNETLLKMAEKYNVSIAQLCLKWCLQNDVIPLPKSQNEERMKQNLDLFYFNISDSDMNIINNMEFFAGSDMDPNKS